MILHFTQKNVTYFIFALEKFLQRTFENLNYIELLETRDSFIL